MKPLNAEGSRLKKALFLAFSLQLSACSHPQPAPPAEPAPAPAPPGGPAPLATIAASSVSGSYRMQVEMQSGNKPEPRNPRAVQPTMSLATAPATARAADAPAQQFAATITLPGYTRPPRRGRPVRGRPAPTGQDAAWWPISQDSIVLQFSQGPRSQIQLRGAVRGREVHGDVWFVSAESGSSFQLGTFSASRSR